MKKALILLLTLISSLLTALSFPNFDISYLCWFSITPIFLILKNENISFSLLCSFIWGIGCYGILFYWILTNYGFLAWFLMIIIITLYSTLFFILSHIFIKIYSKTPLFLMILVPALWVTIEYVRELGFLGFPWNNLSHSQYENIKIIQISTLTGAYGVSFLIVFVNFSLSLLFWKGTELKGRIVPILVAGVIFLLNFIYGSHVTKSNQPTNNKKITIATIQPNIQTDLEWDSNFVITSIKKYIDLTESILTKKADIIVWAENAVQTPFFFPKNTWVRNEILKTSKKVKSYIVFGTINFESKNRMFNTAGIISPEGKIVGKYYKIKLVPFGEVVPARKYFGIVMKFLNQYPWGKQDYSPGKKIGFFKLKNFNLGVGICYESIFPWISRELARYGADLIVFITDSSWFKNTSAPHQHNAIDIFRAVENKIPVLRSTTTGITSIISPTGKIIKKCPQFKECVIYSTIKIKKNKTVFTKYGDLFAYSCIFLSLSCLFISLFKKNAK